MPYYTTGGIDGKSRADGTTSIIRNFERVANVPNGFVARETPATASFPALAATFTHRSFEIKSKGGTITRHSSTEWVWPYETSHGSGIIGGKVVLNRSGLHVPLDCPDNVRADIRYQMTSMASSSTGSIGKALVNDPLVSRSYAF